MGQNPIEGHALYVNPTYVAELDQSIATATGEVKSTLMSMYVPICDASPLSSHPTADTSHSLMGVRKRRPSDIFNRSFPSMTICDNLSSILCTDTPSDVDIIGSTMRRDWILVFSSRRNVGSAFWLDVKSKVQPGNSSTDSAAGILADAATKSPVPLVTFIGESLAAYG